MIAQSPAQVALNQCRQVISGGKAKAHPWDSLSAGTRAALLNAVTKDAGDWSTDWCDLHPLVQSRILRLIKAINSTDWKGHI